MSTKQVFSRPAFKSGGVFTQAQVPPRLVSKRKGTANILRKKAKLPAPAKRKPSSISAQETTPEQTVSLSDETIKRLFEVSVPDPSDTVWLDKKAELEALGDKTTLPFGREQMTVKKRINFGEIAMMEIDSAKKAKEHAELIKKAIDDGMADSVQGRVDLGLQIGRLIVADAQARLLTPPDRKAIMGSVATLKVETDYIKAGFTRRFWSAEQIKANKMQISIFLVANIEAGADLTAPFKQRVFDPATMKIVDGKSVDITHIFSKMDVPGKPLTPAEEKSGKVPSRHIKYLDLQQKTIEPMLHVLKKIRKGADSNIMNGVEIPPPPPAGVSYTVPIGVWNPIWGKKEGHDLQYDGIALNKPSDLVPVVGLTTTRPLPLPAPLPPPAPP